MKTSLSKQDQHAAVATNGHQQAVPHNNKNTFWFKSGTTNLSKNKNCLARNFFGEKQSNWCRSIRHLSALHSNFCLMKSRKKIETNKKRYSISVDGCDTKTDKLSNWSNKWSNCTWNQMAISQGHRMFCAYRSIGCVIQSGHNHIRL